MRRGGRASCVASGLDPVEGGWEVNFGEVSNGGVGQANRQGLDGGGGVEGCDEGETLEARGDRGVEQGGGPSWGSVAGSVNLEEELDSPVLVNTLFEQKGDGLVVRGLKAIPNLQDDEVVVRVREKGVHNGGSP